MTALVRHVVVFVQENHTTDNYFQSMRAGPTWPPVNRVRGHARRSGLPYAEVAASPPGSTYTRGEQRLSYSLRHPPAHLNSVTRYAAGVCRTASRVGDEGSLRIQPPEEPRMSTARAKTRGPPGPRNEPLKDHHEFGPDSNRIRTSRVEYAVFASTRPAWVRPCQRRWSQAENETTKTARMNQHRAGQQS